MTEAGTVVQPVPVEPLTEQQMAAIRTEIDAAKPAPTRFENWYANCQTSARGDVLCNVANALYALRHAPEWEGVLGYDDMRRQVTLRKPIPSLSGVFPALCEVRPVTDDDVTSVQEWLQIAGLPHVSRDTVHQAVDRIARENTYHPVRDYLEGLTWDGVPRLVGGTMPGGDIVPGWLSAYLGAVDSEYTRAVGRMILIAMVARVFDPGCQVDCMLVLESAQGFGKSSACRILGGEFFSEAIPGDLGSKDAQQHLRGKWLVEFSELHALSRSEVNIIKAFVSRRVEIYRPSYGRKEVHEPRQCVFIGTTNKEEYLRDETGNRRFWPIRAGIEFPQCRKAELARDRDQLFAEAVHRYRAGEAWWADADFEREHIAPQQEARFEQDAWEERIAAFLAGTYPVLAEGELPSPLDRVTVLEVARKALHMDTPRMGTADQRRVTAALERLGWERAPRGSNGERYWRRSVGQSDAAG